MEKVILSAIVFSLVGLGATGQAVPGLMNYQGTLIDSGGTAVALGTYTLEFRIYDSAEAGTVVWGPLMLDGGTATGHGPQVYVTAEGNFNVMVGPQDTAGRQLTNAFNGADRYLEVAFDDGSKTLQTLSPRQKILSAPFALRAGNADTLDGQHGAYFLNIANMAAGTLSADRFSAYSDLTAEGLLDNNADSDLLTRAQTDTRYVNEAQSGSVTSAMITDGTVSPADLQDGAALTEILDDDGAGSKLDADKLDGLDATSFLAATTDNWVNIGGDKMTGALQIEGAFVVLYDSTDTSIVAENKAVGAAVKGRATATTGTNYGGRFSAAGDTGIGVMGEAPNTVNAVNYGGYFTAGGVHGQGVRAKATSTGNVINYGGYFETDAAQGRGVYGTANYSGAGTAYGGMFKSISESGIGVRGDATGVLGHGVHGIASGDSGYGVYGNASGASGYGVYGIASGNVARGIHGEASGTSGRAVEGAATNTGNVTNYGGYFTASGTSGHGVYARSLGTSGTAMKGEATATGAITNYGGHFTAAGQTGMGVYGEASYTGTTATMSRGVMGAAKSKYGQGVAGEAAGTNAAAVSGNATAAADAQNFGGFFTAAGSLGAGVWGEATYSGSGTNVSRGVHGKSSGAYAQGVAGESSGQFSYGVYGGSTGSSGRAVVGVAGATGDTTAYGGHFTSNSGLGRGVYGTATGASGIAVQGNATQATGKDFYASGAGANYTPFTGSHEVRIDGLVPQDLVPGMVVCVTGECAMRYDENGQPALSSTLPTVRLANQPNDKTVFGVFISENPLPDDHWYKAQAGERFGLVNALGEGRVWVTDANGPIEAGDYLTTSSIPGYGQRQDDDLLHSFTLGKATESVDWNTVTDTVEFEGRVVKAVLLGVVYTSG